MISLENKILNFCNMDCIVLH